MTVHKYVWIFYLNYCVFINISQHQILWYSKIILLIIVSVNLTKNHSFESWIMIISITFDINFFFLINVFCGMVWQRNPKKECLMNTEETTVTCDTWQVRGNTWILSTLHLTIMFVHDLWFKNFVHQQ